MVANACPHRGASLFFGRNEEEGLRCVYHGWKFDVDGDCVDMPSEPPESNFKSRCGSGRTRASSATAWSGPTWGRARCRRRCPSFECNTAAPEIVLPPRLRVLRLQLGAVDRGRHRLVAHRLPALASDARGAVGGAGRLRPGDVEQRPHAEPRWPTPMDYGAVYAGQRRWDDEGATTTASPSSSCPSTR